MEKSKYLDLIAIIISALIIGIIGYFLLLKEKSSDVEIVEVCPEFYSEYCVIDTINKTIYLRIDIDYSSPDHVKMFYALHKYSAKHDVPIDIAFGIASKETGYRGIFHEGYVGNLGYSGRPVGPMQIYNSTAEFVWKDKVSEQRLRNDIDFNVETAMMTMRYLYEIYGDWEKALGVYNTGKPIKNSYGKYVCDFNYKK
jgi:hypothetical protein